MKNPNNILLASIVVAGLLGEAFPNHSFSGDEVLGCTIVAGLWGDEQGLKIGGAVASMIGEMKADKEAFDMTLLAARLLADKFWEEHAKAE